MKKLSKIFAVISFYFHNESKIGNNGLSDDILIWEAKTKLNGGQLILTIVKDNVSTYEGKILILNQRPIEDDDNYEGECIICAAYKCVAVYYPVNGQ